MGLLEEVRARLTAQGIGSSAAGSTGWRLVDREFQPGTDQTSTRPFEIAITPTGGLPPLVGGELDYRTVQLRLRASATGSTALEQRAEDASSALHLVSGPIYGVSPAVPSYWVDSRKRHDPLYLGRDEQMRPVYALNVEVWRSRTAFTTLLSTAASASLSTTYWAGSASVTSGVTDPNGGSGAWTVSDASTSAVRSRTLAFSLSSTATGDQRAWSYVKAGTAAQTRLRVLDGSSLLGAVDLAWSGGTPTPTAVSPSTHAVVQQVTSAWWVAEWNLAPSSASTAMTYAIDPAGSSAGQTGTVTVYRPQLRHGPV